MCFLLWYFARTFKILANIWSIITNDNLYVENKTKDKDIIFRVCDAGTYTEIARFDGSESSLLMASGKQIQLGGTGTYISGDNTTITVNGNTDFGIFNINLFIIIIYPN